MEFWVRSTDGDALAYILRPSFSELTSNDNASSTTKDAHVTATIATAGTYFVVIRDVAQRTATFTVTFGAGPVTPISTDPFDVNSCSGPALTHVQLATLLGDGDGQSQNHRQLVQPEVPLMARQRSCPTCNDWTTPRQHTVSFYGRHDSNNDNGEGTDPVTLTLWAYSPISRHLLPNSAWQYGPPQTVTLMVAVSGCGFSSSLLCLGMFFGEAQTTTQSSGLTYGYWSWMQGTSDRYPESLPIPMTSITLTSAPGCAQLHALSPDQKTEFAALFQLPR